MAKPPQTSPAAPSAPEPAGAQQPQSALDRIIAIAELVLSDLPPVADAAIAVAGMIPGGGAVVSTIKAVEAVEPAIAKDVMAVVAQGKTILADASPLITQLKAVWDQLFHVTVTPQAIVLTPKATAATAPAVPGTQDARVPIGSARTAPPTAPDSP